MEDTERRPTTGGNKKKMSYRQRLKLMDPEKYQLSLDEQKIRSKLYRKKMSALSSKLRSMSSIIPEDQQRLTQYKKKIRLRQIKWRNKMKRQNNDVEAVKKENNKKNVAKTRNNVKEQRGKWRVAKQKQRAKLNNYEKRWIRQKDKERKQKNKTIKHDKLIVSPSAFNSKQTLYNKVFNLKSKFPKTPEKIAEIMCHMQNNASPNKKEALRKARKNCFEESTFTSPSRIGEKATMTDASTASTDSHKQIKKSKPTREVQKAKQLVHRSWDMLFKQRRRIDSAKYMKEIQEFYLAISRPLPIKRYATKHGPGYVLQMTLKSAYRHFRLQYPEATIGFTKFTLLRPKNVRLLSKAHWEHCVCTVCANVNYKIHALDQACCKHQRKDLQVKYLKGLTNSLLCCVGINERFFKFQCVNGECSKCSNVEAQIKSHYQPLLDENSEKDIIWHHWEKKDQDDRVRKVLVSKKSTIADCIQEFINDVKEPVQGCSFFKHNFKADWQQLQFINKKSELKDDEVLMVLDFGKNYSVKYQDAAKCTGCATKQTTVHPVVMLCDKILDLTKRDSMVFLSDDTQHDFFAVNYFLKEAIEYIKTIKQTVRKFIIFSDGCASQYKGKGSLASLSLSKFPIEWNYFGSGHGKSESDGELGSINRAVEKAVLGRQVIISDAEDLHGYCSDALSFDEGGSKRHFKLVPMGKIQRDGQETNVKTLRGTRDKHQAKNIHGKPYQIATRSLTCYCKGCEAESSFCLNSNYVKPFVTKELTRIDNGDQINQIKEEVKASQFFTVMVKRVSLLRNKYDSYRIIW